MQAKATSDVQSASTAGSTATPRTDDARVWVTVEGAADRAEVSTSTVLREARSGRLRGYRVGGRKLWRFRPEDIDAWLMHS